MGLGEDVLHAFEGGGDGEEIFAATDGGHGFGAGYEVASHIDVRLAFELEHTGFSLDGGSSAYHATGAAETLLGGRIMVGYSF